MMFDKVMVALAVVGVALTVMTGEYAQLFLWMAYGLSSLRHVWRDGE